MCIGVIGPAWALSAPFLQCLMQGGLLFQRDASHCSEQFTALRDVTFHRLRLPEKLLAQLQIKGRFVPEMQERAHDLESAAVLAGHSFDLSRAEQGCQRRIEMFLFEGNVRASGCIQSSRGLNGRSHVAGAQRLRQIVKAFPENSVVLAECLE